MNAGRLLVKGPELVGAKSYSPFYVLLPVYSDDGLGVLSQISRLLIVKRLV